MKVWRRKWFILISFLYFFIFLSSSFRLLLHNCVWCFMCMCMDLVVWNKSCVCQRRVPGYRNRGRQRRRWTDSSPNGLAWRSMKRQQQRKIVIIGERYYAPPTLLQCCRPCGQWHTEVWSWLDVTPPRWASLAGCTREGYLQDRCHGVPLSSRSGTSVHRRPSHHILRRRFTASSALVRSANQHQLSTQHIRPSGTHCLTSSEIRRVFLDNVVTNRCAKFDDDRLWNEKALVPTTTPRRRRRRRTFVAIGDPFPGPKLLMV